MAVVFDGVSDAEDVMEIVVGVVPVVLVGVSVRGVVIVVFAGVSGDNDATSTVVCEVNGVPAVKPDAAEVLLPDEEVVRV